MKLLRGDGRRLEVYDLGAKIMTIEEGPLRVPIPFHGWAILDDEAARERLRSIVGITDDRGERLYEVKR